MPSFPAPRAGIRLSDALAEAYAISPVDEPVLVTLEIHHPDFKDAAGNPTAGRIVNDWDDLVGVLEYDAPLDGGTPVLFKACPFNFTEPEQTDTGAPAATTVEIENVSREISMLLDQAVESMVPVLMIVRKYMPSDTASPHELPPTRLYLTKPIVDASKVTLTASFGNLTNRRFPTKRYKRKQYAALSSR